MQMKRKHECKCFANAWVNKLLNIFENQKIDVEKLYPLLRKNGFIYGTNLSEIYIFYST